MKVRKTRTEDFIEVHKLILSIFPNAIAKIKENDEFLVAEENGEIFGFVHFSEDENKIILKGFGVMEKFRKRGIGGQLLDELINYGKTKRKNIYLKTKLENRAVNLYSRKGFCFKRVKGESVTMVYRIAN